MRQIPYSPDYPAGARYAMFSRDGSFIQGFYKLVEEQYNDGTTTMRLYHKSSLPVWQPSTSYSTLKELCSQEFEVVEIASPFTWPRQNHTSLLQIHRLGLYIYQVGTNYKGCYLVGSAEVDDPQAICRWRIRILHLTH